MNKRFLWMTLCLIAGLMTSSFLLAAKQRDSAKAEVAELQAIIAEMQENPYVLVIEKEVEKEPEVDPEELELLARLIYREIGSDWTPDTQLYIVGSVALNRVADERYPNNLHDVVYQNIPCWQYGPAARGTLETAEPTERCYRIAEELLKYGSRMPPAVVWQSGEPQGLVIAWYDDPYTGERVYYGTIGEGK